MCKTLWQIATHHRMVFIQWHINTDKSTSDGSLVLALGDFESSWVDFDSSWVDFDVRNTSSSSSSSSNKPLWLVAGFFMAEGVPLGLSVDAFCIEDAYTCMKQKLKIYAASYICIVG